MEECDQVLMIMLLNTPEKIHNFVEWARTKTVNDRIQSTPEEVMHIVAMIDREEDPLA